MKVSFDHEEMIERGLGNYPFPVNDKKNKSAWWITLDAVQECHGWWHTYGAKMEGGYVIEFEWDGNVYFRWDSMYSVRRGVKIVIPPGKILTVDLKQVSQRLGSKQTETKRIIFQLDSQGGCVKTGI